MKNILKSKYLLPFLAAALMTGGCKKNFLETSPSNQVTTDKIFATTSAAQTAMDGLYRLTYTFGVPNPVVVYSGHDLYGQKSYDLLNDLMGQDMTVATAGYGWYNADYRYTAQLTATDASRSNTTWLYYYQLINGANAIINNIDAATGTQDEKDALKGQALALRAHSYFYLITFYQQTYKGNEGKPGVPIYTTNTSTGAPRGTVQNVYDTIVNDLSKAETLLDGKTRRDLSSIDVNAVRAIRAKVALQMEDYPTAATYAQKVIPNYSLMDNAAATPEYTKGFNTISNSEWVWGAQVIVDQATIYASFWSHMDPAPGGYATLGQQKKITKALYDQIPAGDVRKLVFTAPADASQYYPAYTQTKFHLADPNSWAGDYMYISVAEMYLIKAEALQRQGQDGPARTALETLIKNRYPAYSAAAFSGPTLLAEILLQRRIELWGEGFGFLDIKRLKSGLNRATGTGNFGTGSLDPSIYTLSDQDPKYLYRIPQEELNANKSMTAADQNP